MLIFLLLSINAINSRVKNLITLANGPFETASNSKITVSRVLPRKNTHTHTYKHKDAHAYTCTCAKI